MIEAPFVWCGASVLATSTDPSALSVASWGFDLKENGEAVGALDPFRSLASSRRPHKKTLS
jgi:hypothetical protein